MADIKDTLAERGERYGLFEHHAEYAEKLIKVYETSANWKDMRADSKQALRTIADKIARILNGDPEYADNWHDIAGYATLVDQRIERDKENEIIVTQVPMLSVSDRITRSVHGAK